jgi:hypothetical protein
MPWDALSKRWGIPLFALVLGAAHVIAPRFRRLIRYPERQQAFGGGLSVAYAFLHLIPSLDASDGVVGPRIHLTALLGFVVFYGLDVLFQPPNHRHPTKCHAYLAVFFAISLALDVLDTELELEDEHAARSVESGRWILLAGVALAGFMIFYTFKGEFPVSQNNKFR